MGAVLLLVQLALALAIVTIDLLRLLPLALLAKVALLAIIAGAFAVFHCWLLQMGVLTSTHTTGTVIVARCFSVGAGLPLPSDQPRPRTKASDKVTYCLGMLLESGLVLMADTRTNAGVDNFSTFRKLHTLCDDANRQVYVATAGSLSLSQAAIGLLREDQHTATGRRKRRGLDQADSMFKVAQLVGETVASVGATIGAALEREHIDNTLEMLVGGRIGVGPLKLYLIYTIGNFIECTSDVPFLQIGETKYGRPILDRALDHRTPLAEAVKIGVLSFDSTMESNLGVARPIDLLVLPSDRGRVPLQRRIQEDDSYFLDTTRRWAKILNDGVMHLPDPPWMANES